jgi:hypothetical protein
MRVLIPGRAGFEEEDEEVVCDPAFLEAVKLAVGPVEGVKKSVHPSLCCV